VLTTALAGANNDLVYTARDGGPGGNEITVNYVVAGANTLLTVTVGGKEIVVNVATDGASVATSTATLVKAAVEANADAALLVTIALAGSDTGAGIVAALAATPLAGGALGVAQPAQTNSDAANDMYLTGNDGLVLLEVFNNNGGSQTVQFLLAPPAVRGMAVAAGFQTETIAAAATRVLGPFPVGLFNQNAAGDVYFDPSVVTDLKFRAYKAVRAQ